LLGVGLAACGSSSDGNKATPTSASRTPTTPGANGGGGAGGSTVTLTVSDGTGVVGQTAAVDLKVLDVGAPGLGAYTVDVSYDADIVTAETCNGAGGPGTPAAATTTPNAAIPGLSFCNPKYAFDQVRAVGAITQGATGDLPLANIVFTCKKAGSSALTISVDTLADATIGDPTDINHTEQNGTITCS
jgi:hypothetical protein